MERLIKILYHHAALFMLVFILAGCTGTTDEAAKTEEDTSTTVIKDSDISDPNNNSSVESHNSDSKTSSSENSGINAGEKNDKETLSQFSNEQIEYARVWLQLGPNQEIDELNVRHIPAGEPLNPDDETSANYPENVIQLAGSRLADGSVTYSGNGDGTINVYNVPLRWDGSYPAGEDFYREIIDNTNLVSIEPGDDREIVKLIKLLKVQ